MLGPGWRVTPCEPTVETLQVSSFSTESTLWLYKSRVIALKSQDRKLRVRSDCIAYDKHVQWYSSCLARFEATHYYGAIFVLVNAMLAEATPKADRHRKLRGSCDVCRQKKGGPLFAFGIPYFALISGQRVRCKLPVFLWADCI